MRSPCRVEFVSDLDRNEDSSRSFPSGWCRAFAMGSPVSGRVAHFCALDRNEGFFRSSILSCVAMGSPCGSSVFFSHSIVTKSALDIWSVFLQDGVTPVGSGSVDLISKGVYPSSQRRSGFWPSSSGPVASRPPLGIGQLRRPCGDPFHLGVFMRWSSTHWGLASGSSGSRTSRYGLLVYVQGASVSASLLSRA